jgi:hypothetical protein
MRPIYAIILVILLLALAAISTWSTIAYFQLSPNESEMVKRAGVSTVLVAPETPGIALSTSVASNLGFEDLVIPSPAAPTYTTTSCVPFAKDPYMERCYTTTGADPPPTTHTTISCVPFGKYVPMEKCSTVIAVDAPTASSPSLV